MQSDDKQALVSGQQRRLDVPQKSRVSGGKKKAGQKARFR
jgi:hypothetical protein